MALNSYLIKCGKILRDKKLSIAFAESASAGRLIAEFSLLPHPGDFLKGGIVCYDAKLKEHILKVPSTLIKTFTPESIEVTTALAEGLVQLIQADIHVAVTGLPSAGGSETAEKPVGTMFIVAIYHGNLLFKERIVFKGKPEEIILKSIKHTAKLLTEYLLVDS